MKTVLKLLALLTACVLCLAACGGEEEAPAAEGGGFGGSTQAESYTSGETTGPGVNEPAAAMEDLFRGAILAAVPEAKDIKIYPQPDAHGYSFLGAAYADGNQDRFALATFQAGADGAMTLVEWQSGSVLPGQEVVYVETLPEGDVPLYRFFGLAKSIHVKQLTLIYEAHDPVVIDLADDQTFFFHAAPDIWAQAVDVGLS